MAKRMLMVMSYSSLDRKHQADQHRALVLLSAIGIVPEKFPADDPGQAEKRDRLLSISKMKGVYPQFFVIDDEDESNIKFVGCFDDIQIMADDNELSREALGLSPVTETASSSDPAAVAAAINAEPVYVGVQKEAIQTGTLDAEKIKAVEQQLLHNIEPAHIEKDPVHAAEPGTVPNEVERLERSERSHGGKGPGAVGPEPVAAATAKAAPRDDKSIDSTDFIEELVVTDDEFEEESLEDEHSRSTDAASRTAEGDDDWMAPPKVSSGISVESSHRDNRSGDENSSWMGPSQKSGSRGESAHDPFVSDDDDDGIKYASKEDLFPEDPFDEQMDRAAASVGSGSWVSPPSVPNSQNDREQQSSAASMSSRDDSRSGNQSGRSTRSGSKRDAPVRTSNRHAKTNQQQQRPPPPTPPHDDRPQRTAQSAPSSDNQTPQRTNRSGPPQQRPGNPNIPPQHNNNQQNMNRGGPPPPNRPPQQRPDNRNVPPPSQNNNNDNSPPMTTQSAPAPTSQMQQQTKQNVPPPQSNGHMGPNHNNNNNNTQMDRAIPAVINKPRTESYEDLESQRQRMIRKRQQMTEQTRKEDRSFHILVVGIILLIAGGGAAVIGIFYEPSSS